MSVPVQYAAVNARIKAIMGKMLTTDDYKKIINASTVQEVFNYLYNNTYYHTCLEGLNGVEIHRREMELTLKKSFINDYRVIYRYLQSDSKDFFKQLFAKFEIEDLKMLLRTILVENNEGYLKKSLIYLGVYTDIDINLLTSIKSYQDLLAAFENTDYYKILSRFTDSYEKERNLFPIEMSLDFQYFSSLEKLAKKLSSADYKYVEDLIGTQVDLLNIQWIYRIKKYYNLSPGEILNYILPFHHKLSRENLRNMADVDKPEEIVKYIANKQYQEVFNAAIEENNVIFERYFLSYILSKSKSVKRTSFYNIGNIIAYLFIKEYEIRDIITIVEGVRYSLNTSEIKKYLIRDGV